MIDEGKSLGQTMHGTLRDFNVHNSLIDDLTYELLENIVSYAWNADLSEEQIERLLNEGNAEI